MLFNLAAAIGIETDQNDSFSRVQSGESRSAVSIATAGLSDNRVNRAEFKPEILDNIKPAANDELPEHHYKGENLAFWMMPTASVDALRLKHGDSAWIAAKLRRVPASQRQKVADEYSAQYKATYDAEPDGNKKANKAAFAANAWLLRATR